MSNETWIAEFYPKKANQTSEAEAVQHSLQKWIGLRAENLKKHELDVLPINVDSGSCALCHHHCFNRYDVERDDSGINATCQTCPLAKSLGRACNQDVDDEPLPPWMSWCFNANPEPMIAALEAVPR